MSELQKCLCGEKDVEECAYSCALNDVNSYVEVKEEEEFDYGEPVDFDSLIEELFCNTNKSFEAVKDFHLAFNHPAPESPTAIPVKTAVKRASWTAEEIVEFLHASVGGNQKEFLDVMDQLDTAIEKAVEKQLKEGEYEDKSDAEILVRQVDALTDISYFNYGSFVVAGVDPQPFFDVVQAANMGKLDRETGKPIIRESDGKIMKPDYWESEFAPEPRLREELKRQMKQ